MLLEENENFAFIKESTLEINWGWSIAGNDATFWVNYQVAEQDFCSSCTETHSFY